MGYPAEISGADDDPVMQAIRAKFMQQNVQIPASRMPTDILPEHVRIAAQRAVLAQNANAKPVALQSQMQAMHADPAIMQQIMSQYGPDMVAQYGGGNGIVQQPQAIQQSVPSTPQQASPQAAQGIPQAYAQEVAAPSGISPEVAAGAGPAAPVDANGMDPALATALGIAGGAAVGGGAGYLAGKFGNRQQATAVPAQDASPTMRQAVPDDFGAHDIDQSVQKAVMTAPEAPIVAPDQVDNAAFRAASKPVVEDVVPPSIDESGIPEHMRFDVATPPKTFKTQRMHKDADMNDQHMRSIIMEGQPSAPVEQPVTQTQAAPEGQVVEAPAKKTRKKKADAPKAASEASTEAPTEPKKKRSRTKVATNADGTKDVTTNDVSEIKKFEEERSLASKADAVAVDSAPKAEAPVKENKPRKKKAKAPTVETDDTPAPAKKKISKLDTNTAPGAKTFKGMSLAEAKTLLKPEPDLAVIDKFKVYDMTDTEFKALQAQAKELIRASKSVKTVSPKATAREETAKAVVQEPKERISYSYDDKDEAIMKAIKEPVVVERPKQRKALTPAEATARLLAMRAK